MVASGRTSDDAGMCLQRATARRPVDRPSDAVKDDRSCDGDGQLTAVIWRELATRHHQGQRADSGHHSIAEEPADD